MLVGLVFSNEHRSPWLTDELRTELYPYLCGTLRNLEPPSLEIGGTADHVHILFRLPRTLTVAQVVKEAKTESSKWAKGLPGTNIRQGEGEFVPAAFRCGYIPDISPRTPRRRKGRQGLCHSFRS
jgi:hypothetical protein